MDCPRCSQTMGATSRCSHCGFQVPGFALGLDPLAGVHLEAPEAYVESIEAVAEKIDEFLNFELAAEELWPEVEALQTTLAELTIEMALALDDTLRQEQMLTPDTSHQTFLRIHLQLGTDYFGQGLERIGQLLQGQTDLAEPGLDSLRKGGDHLVAAARILSQRQQELQIWAAN